MFEAIIRLFHILKIGGKLFQTVGVKKDRVF